MSHSLQSPQPRPNLLKLSIDLGGPDRRLTRSHCYFIHLMNQIDETHAKILSLTCQIWIQYLAERRTMSSAAQSARKSDLAWRDRIGYKTKDHSDDANDLLHECHAKNRAISARNLAERDPLPNSHF